MRAPPSRQAEQEAAARVLMRRSASAAEARFLPPNTPRRHDLPRNKYGSEWSTGGGPERWAMQTQTSQTLPWNHFICRVARNQRKSERTWEQTEDALGVR